MTENNFNDDLSVAEQRLHNAKMLNMKVYDYAAYDDDQRNGKANYMYEQVPTRAQFMGKDAPRSGSLVQAGES
jgi:hypothetical protein